jgi:outer membrane protein OmpA-like peptidoglycan-associated protein
LAEKYRDERAVKKAVKAKETALQAKTEALKLLAQESALKAREAQDALTQGKAAEAAIAKITNEEYKEKVYEEKIKAYKAVSEKAKETIEKADKAISMADETTALAGEDARYGDSVKTAQDAKEKAEKIKREALELLNGASAAIRENEDLENQRQEEEILSGAANERLEQEKKEADARREKPAIKRFSMTLNFDFDKYELSQESKERIREVAQEVKKYEYKKITIEGHTDNIGEKAHNIVLSRNRAKSVKEELEKYEIEEDKLNHAGFADTMPVESNDSKSGRAANRRTEVFVE